MLHIEIYLERQEAQKIYSKPQLKQSCQKVCQKETKVTITFFPCYLWFKLYSKFFFLTEMKQLLKFLDTSLYFIKLLKTLWCVTSLCLVSHLCNPKDCRPPGFSVHGDSPSKKTGVGCHAFLQGIFPVQGSNPGLPHCRWILYHLSHQ